MSSGAKRHENRCGTRHAGFRKSRARRRDPRHGVTCISARSGAGHPVRRGRRRRRGGGRCWNGATRASVTASFDATNRYRDATERGGQRSPDPQFMPRKGEEEGAKGAAAPLMADDSATPLDFFLLFNAHIVDACPPERRIFPGGA